MPRFHPFSNRVRFDIILFTLSLPAFVTTALTQPPARWPGFLGPGGLAVAMGEDAAAIPTAFGENDANVLWKVPSGSGHSSPVIWDRLLFLSSADDGGKQLIMTAYDRHDGSVVWERHVTGEAEDSYGHQAAHPAMPTACTDGRQVFFYFGGYGLIALAVETGAPAWEKRFAFEPQMFGTGTSPVILDDSVFLVRDGGKDSAIWCFDASTGDVRWNVPRPGFRTTYTTPFVWKNRERTELVMAGTNSLHAYNPENGDLLWSVGDLCIFPCTTPVGDSERLYFAAWATPNAEGVERAEANFWGDVEVNAETASDPDWFFRQFDADKDGRLSLAELPESRGRDAFNFVDRDRDGFWDKKELEAAQFSGTAPGRNLMIAVEAGRNGVLTEKAGILWTYDKVLPYVPSPLVVGNRVILVKSGGILSTLDAATGKALHRPTRCGVSGEYYASPVAAGERILLCAHRGTVLVLENKGSLEVVAKNQIGESIYATPAVVDGVLYLRSDRHLWAIGTNK